MTLPSIVLSIPRNPQLPPIFMTTTSAANSSCKFNKRLKTTSASGLVQGERKSPDSSDDDGRELNPMKRLKAETKEVSTTNGGIIINSIVKEKMMIRYRECRKNHAASIGGYAVDGCHEFMPAGEEGTTAAFNCAACTCHRNFHKKEVENDCYCDCSSISAATTTK